MKTKVDKTAEIVDELEYESLTPDALNDIKGTWSKMEGKIHRDWNKLGMELKNSFLSIAEQGGAADPEKALEHLDFLL